MGTERNTQPILKTELEENDAVPVNNRGYMQSVDSAFFLDRLVTNFTIDGQTVTITFASGKSIDITLP